jgi:transcriptional regulator with XRE-family HTH domain
LGRVAISEIENGRRRVSLDEAFLLAAALNVPPPLLLLALESGEHIAVTSKSVIHPDLAYQWLTGEAPLASTERFATGLYEWSEAAWTEAATPIRLYAAHRRAFSKANDADLDILRAEAAKDAKGATSARYRLTDRLRDLVKVRDQMRARKMKPPKLFAPGWSAELKRIGEGG